MTIIDKIGKYKQPGREWFNRGVSGIKVFSIHHDAIPRTSKPAEDVMQQIMNGHVKNGWPGASYHYYIHRDGKVYQMNKHEWVTWVDGVNWDCIGIVMHGYMHPDSNNTPTVEQLGALKELLDELSTKHPEFPADQNDVYGHRERAQTSCPGDKFFPYVQEYRLKNGDVAWPNPPINPQPPMTGDAQRAIEVVDRVRIRDGHGNLEGAARAMDQATIDNKQLRIDLEIALGKIQKAQADLA